MFFTSTYTQREISIELWNDCLMFVHTSSSKCTKRCIHLAPNNDKKQINVMSALLRWLGVSFVFVQSWSGCVTWSRYFLKHWTASLKSNVLMLPSFQCSFISYVFDIWEMKVCVHTVHSAQQSLSTLNINLHLSVVVFFLFCSLLKSLFNEWKK